MADEEVVEVQDAAEPEVEGAAQEQGEAQPVESGGGRRTEHQMRRDALIDLYEGRNPDDSRVPYDLWVKIQDAKRSNVRPVEVEDAYRDRDREQQEAVLRSAVNDALQPLTPDYFNRDTPEGDAIEGIINARVAETLAAHEDEQINAAHQARVAEFKSAHEDWDAMVSELMERGADINESVGRVIAQLPNGPEVLYAAYKTGNIDRWSHLKSQRDVDRAIAEATLLSAKLEVGSGSQIGPAHIHRNPPKPPTPVRKTSPGAKTIDEIVNDGNSDFKTWVKARNEQIRLRGRG